VTVEFSLTAVSITRYQCHHQQISAVSFSPDDRYVLSSSWDSRVILWDIEAGQLRFDLNLESTGAAVTTAIFSPSGAYIASGAWDVGAIIWSTDTGEQFIVLNTQHLSSMTSMNDFELCSLAFSPNEKLIAGASIELGVPPGYLITVWDVFTGQQMFQINTDHETGILWHEVSLSVKFSADSEHILSKFLRHDPDRIIPNTRGDSESQ
jgi:WD40 repeat protein